MSEADPVSPNVAARRRPRGRAALLSMLGLLVVLLLVVGAVGAGYGMTHPLSEGSSSSGLWVCDPATELPDCDGDVEAALYPGARFQYFRTVRNDGLAPITILGLSHPDFSMFEWLSTATILEDHLYLMGPDDITDLTPVSLAPGEELPLVIRGRIRPCAPPMPEGGNMVLTGLQVRYRLLAVEHVAMVDVADPVSVPFNPCPGED